MLNARPKILLVEDDHGQALLIEESLSLFGGQTDHVQSRAEADDALGRSDFDLVILDIELPDGTGFEIQESLRQRGNAPPLLFVTCDELPENAVRALEAGAAGYVVKRPSFPEKLTKKVSELLSGCCGLSEDSALRTENEAMPELLGTSQAMADVRWRVSRASSSDEPVLISGETGTGKELVARAVHRLSARGEAPFIAVNCAAITPALFESEFFGHVNGAFTGANRSRSGLLEAARGGTIFLDEVGELSLEAQSKLLRVLEDGSYRRVGETREVRADARIVVATNRDLLEESRKSSFRLDLYYRLDVIQIQLPPLRERLEDIPVLVDHFVNAENRRGACRVVPERALLELKCRSWPGNVRELRHTVVRTLVWRDDAVIHHFDLPVKSKGESSEATIDRICLDKLTSLLTLYRGRQKPVATELGVSVRTLQRRMVEFNLRTRDYRSA